jgi:hypothetical protein
MTKLESSTAVVHLAVNEAVAGSNPASPAIIIIGTAAEVIDFLWGPRQHDEHMKGYRWGQYMADQKKRIAAMNDEARKIIAAANARREQNQHLEAAE